MAIEENIMAMKIISLLTISLVFLFGCSDGRTNRMNVINPDDSGQIGGILFFVCVDYLKENDVSFPLQGRRDNMYWLQLPNEHVAVDLWSRDGQSRFLFILAKDHESNEFVVIQAKRQSPINSGQWSPLHAEDP